MVISRRHIPDQAHRGVTRRATRGVAGQKILGGKVGANTPLSLPPPPFFPLDRFLSLDRRKTHLQTFLSKNLIFESLENLSFKSKLFGHSSFT